MKKKRLKKYLRKYAAKHGIAAQQRRDLRIAALQETMERIGKVAREFEGADGLRRLADKSAQCPPYTLQARLGLRKLYVAPAGSFPDPSRSAADRAAAPSHAGVVSEQPVRIQAVPIGCGGAPEYQGLPRLALLRFLDSPYAPRLIELLRKKDEIYCEIAAILDEALGKGEKKDEI